MSNARSCRVLVCTNQRFGAAADSCGRRGAEQVLAALQDAARLGLLPGDVRVEAGPCFGHCKKGPNVRIVGGPMLYEVRVGEDGDGLTRVVAAVVSCRKLTERVPDDLEPRS